MKHSRAIDIASFPEQHPNVVPHHSRSGSHRKRSKRAVPAGDIIELFDSDDDNLNIRPKHRSKSKKSRDAAASSQDRVRAEVDAAPIAGSSRVKPAKAPLLFLFESEDERRPSSSKRKHKKDKHLAPLAVPPIKEPFVPGPAPDPSFPMDVEVDFDRYVVQVLDIVPDVLPSHVSVLVERHFPAYKENVVERVVNILFEDATYPKVDKKGKGKRKREDDDEDEVVRAVKPKLDYASKDRKQEGGVYYGELALTQLSVDFPYIPVSHVRTTFRNHNSLYAPTHLFLLEEQKSKHLPYKRKVIATRSRTKGKGIEHADAEFEKERDWLKAHLEEEETAQVIKELQADDEDEEPGIECGCCFTEYSFDSMIQCPEAHLFCKSCMTSYAETKLGEHDAKIVCMDQSGCKLAFPESELRRFLTPKLLALYERIQQRKEIEAAGLENLEECPFCDYKVVIENDHERLFRCENEQCGAVTCRKCKKPDHLPKSCEEMEADKKLDGRHAIEEAMTRALMRNCPKCQKAFVKEMGCNKMTCPNCHTLSCYVCRKVIKGYDHFNNPPPYNGPHNPNKCMLWDKSVEQRHNEEVTAAQKRAMEEYKRAHPDISEKDLKVDLPPAPVAGPSKAAPVQHHGIPAIYMLPLIPAVPLPAPVPAPGRARARGQAREERERERERKRERKRERAQERHRIRAQEYQAARLRELAARVREQEHQAARERLAQGYQNAMRILHGQHQQYMQGQMGAGYNIHANIQPMLAQPVPPAPPAPERPRTRARARAEGRA